MYVRLIVPLVEGIKQCFHSQCMPVSVRNRYVSEIMLLEIALGDIFMVSDWRRRLDEDLVASPILDEAAGLTLIKRPSGLARFQHQ
jgi:hypothetical protein